MKKLNITKEAFQKSRYFTKKYGELEYVSESGKMFKTNKGKVLMFKESIKDIAPGIQDWGSTIYVEPLEVEMSWDDVYYIVKKDCRLYPLLEEELGLEPYEEPSDEQIREWIETNPKSFMDYLEEFGSYNATDFSGDDEYDESTKKFGRKIANESMNWNGVTDKFLDNGKVQFTRNCPSCGKPHSITVSIQDVEDGCSKYGRGARIQDAFPNFSPDEREFFMSGICPDCWENM